MLENELPDSHLSGSFLEALSYRSLAKDMGMGPGRINIFRMFQDDIPLHIRVKRRRRDRQIVVTLRMIVEDVF
jgi:hypothetical protein